MVEYRKVSDVILALVFLRDPKLERVPERYVYHKRLPRGPLQESSSADPNKEHVMSQ